MKLDDVYTIGVVWGRGQSADWMRTDLKFGNGRCHTGVTHVLTITRDLTVDEIAVLMLDAVKIAVEAFSIVTPQMRYVPAEEFDRLMKGNGP